ncbi:MAG: hypothetical protein WD897_01280 [Parcubacteria group bacterium]
MNIAEIVSYDKDGQIERLPLFRKLFLVLTIVLVALLSFGIGRLSVAGNREPIRIEYDPEISNAQLPTREAAGVIKAVQVVPLPRSSVQQSEVVVSKNGARYHYSHCAGAKQINEENKIIFPTSRDAEAAGYTLAANCLPR